MSGDLPSPGILIAIAAADHADFAAQRRATCQSRRPTTNFSDSIAAVGSRGLPLDPRSCAQWYKASPPDDRADIAFECRTQTGIETLTLARFTLKWATDAGP